ncbi:hypothetical protein N184_30935 [Sinorhizobium sp. GL28]|nr:hypothetical protein N184_30935 [Sinorhizobium sp. GL28]
MVTWIRVPSKRLGRGILRASLIGVALVETHPRDAISN